MLGVEHASPAFGFAECGWLVGGCPEVVKTPCDIDQGAIADEGVSANGGIECTGVLAGLLIRTAARCCGIGATGIDPGAPLAAISRITGVGVTGLEGLAIEDAALDVERALTVSTAWVPECQREAVG